MRRTHALVDALAAVASSVSPGARDDKLELLRALADRIVGQPSALYRLHETLCFLQAYPDDPEVLAQVDHALVEFPRRLGRLRRAALTQLRDSGIVGTTLIYPFGLPMTRWLASRFPRDVEVAWAAFAHGERLEEVLALLVTHAEDDAFSEGGLGWRKWLRVAKGGRALTDLQLLVELFDRTPLSPPVRDWFFDSVGLPIRWRLRRPTGSRTQARLPWARPFFGPAGPAPRGLRFVEEVRRPLPTLRRASRPLAESLIEAARLAMATRLRELYGFSYANPDDVLLVDPGSGLRIALIGLRPGFRLPLEGYYAFFVLKNGVPVSYGGGWYLFGTLELGLNVFESFRQGESAFLFSQILRAYRQALGMHVVVVDAYQIGYKNPEALRSGAFYFYHRLGFRPLDPVVLRLSQAEQQKIARDPSYRSPLPILKRLARSELAFTLDRRAPRRRIRARDVAALVSCHVAREFGGDRRAAERHAPRRVAHALGVSRSTRWPPAERRAFERLAMVAALIPDLARWPAGHRRSLVRVFRARGGSSERHYARLLSAHRPLRRSLEGLVPASRAAEPAVVARVGASLDLPAERVTHAG